MAGFLQYHASLTADEKIHHNVFMNFRTFEEFHESIRYCERRKDETKKFSERSIRVAWNMFVCYSGLANSRFTEAASMRYLGINLRQNNKPLIAEVRKVFMHLSKFIRIHYVTGTSPSIQMTRGVVNNHFTRMHQVDVEQLLVFGSMAEQAHNATNQIRPAPIVIEIPKIFRNPLQGLNPEIIFALM